MYSRRPYLLHQRFTVKVDWTGPDWSGMRDLREVREGSPSALRSKDLGRKIDGMTWRMMEGKGKESMGERGEGGKGGRRGKRGEIGDWTQN